VKNVLKAMKRSLGIYNVCLKIPQLGAVAQARQDYQGSIK
jgi:hypothetical protein